LLNTSIHFVQENKKFMIKNCYTELKLNSKVLQQSNMASLA